MHRNVAAAVGIGAMALVGSAAPGAAARGAGGQAPPARVAPAPVPQPPVAAPRPATRRPNAGAAPAAMTPAAQSELVATYCVTCHSDRAKAGGLSLANFNAMLAHESPETAEKMVRKLRAGMMPPAGAKRPPEGALDGLAQALESRMDEFAAVNPNPGWRPFQRLNRAE